MKSVNWLIEKYVFEHYQDKLADAVKRSGNPVMLYDESEKSLEDICKRFGEEDIVFLHSSLQDGRRMLRLPIYPGTFLTLENYECYNYYGYFGDHLLNAKYMMMGIGDLPRRAQHVFNYFDTDSIFIRPSNGWKTFTGQILPKDNFADKYDTLIKSYGGIDPGTLVLLAPIKEIREEWRFGVVDGNVVSGALYMNGENRGEWEAICDKGCEDRGAWDFAWDMSKLYQPDPAYTIDICRTAGGEYKVIELNSFCCASIYGANYDKVVHAINELCRREWKDVYEP